jgi:hypothetical protein
MITASRAGRNYHHCRAEFRVIWVQPFPIDGTNCDGEDRISVAIEITLIIHTSAISSRKDKDGPFSTSSFGDTINHGF